MYANIAFSSYNVVMNNVCKNSIQQLQCIQQVLLPHLLSLTLRITSSWTEHQTLPHLLLDVNKHYICV